MLYVKIHVLLKGVISLLYLVAQICFIYFGEKCFVVPMKQWLLHYSTKIERNLESDDVSSINPSNNLERLEYLNGIQNYRYEWIKGDNGRKWKISKMNRNIEVMKIILKPYLWQLHMKMGNSILFVKFCSKPFVFVGQ